ncbi:putative Ig domain-containing protein [Geothrix sp. 21YS21S-2]|uniref:beta strand repeat-containing protein n=1 Tax=Geothrix sp. 21YS21S-2 TaxID=3068893 RepID=UPI0027B94A69|nr:putative Ig domain-containing protein [Geothrix sp. 21YS21S-2]
MENHHGSGGNLSGYFRNGGLCLLLALALACGGGGGGGGTTAPAAPAVPAIGSFVPSPATVVPGQASTLSWTVSGATSVIIDHGVGAVPGTSATVSPASTTVYTLTAANASGTSTAAATVTVVPPAGIASFTAARSILTAGAATTLTPVFTAATGAAIDQGVGAVTSGTPVTVAPAATTTYTLSVQGAGGTVTSAVTVTVVAAPAIAAFTAVPGAVLPGGAGQLSAVYAGGTGTVDHGLGALPSGGTLATGALAATTDFRLTVTNAAGDAATALATVAVGPGVAITSFAASPSTITAGAGTVLTPGFVNAASAAIDPGVGAVASGTGYPVTPSATTTYTLSATGLGGPVTRSLAVTVVPPAAVASFTSAVPRVVAGTATTLTPVFSGGSGSIDHGVGAVASGAPVPTGGLAAATTFTLTVTNPAGDAVTATAAVGVDCQVTYLAGAGGSILGAGTQTVAPGGTCSAVTAVPAAGWHFTQWSDGSAANPRTDAAVAGNLTVTAGFGINAYALAYAAGANGSLSGVPAQTVAYGASGTPVTAVPATGWHFAQWSDGSAANPRTDSAVAGDVSVTASFVINAYSLAYAAGANGSLAGAASQTVNHGASGSAVTAVPAPGFHFTQWSDGSAANPRTDAAVAGNLAVSAGFAVDTWTLAYAAGANGSISGSASQTVDQGSSGSAVTAVPATGYAFVQWSDGSVANPRTDAAVAGNLSVTASFAIRTFTATFAAGTGGSLGGSTSQTVAYGGSATAVTAIPGGGYSFLNWTGPGGFASTAANPLTVANVTSDLAITANFTTLFVVQFAAGSNGSLTGSTSQAIASGGSASAVTAVPAAGYAFLNWTGTGGFATTSANPLILGNVTANMTVTANFSRLPVINNFHALASTIGRGQQANMAWNAMAFTTSASIDNGVGPVAITTSMAQTYPMVTTTYTLTAVNAVGTSTASVTFTVIPPPAITSFTASPVDLAPGQATTLSWAATDAASYSIDHGVGAVAGTSVSVVPPTGSTTYRLTATSAYGSTSATVTVSSGPPVNLAYGVNPAVFTRNAAITPDSPANGGGPITSYTVAPALPAGLALDPSTGVISGTPQSANVATSYVVRGTNSYGSCQATLILTVNDAAPAFSYPAWAHDFQLNAPIAALAPVNTGGSSTSWSISPPLPAGLALDPATGRISGTPTATASSQAYTVSAANSGGTGSASVTLSVAVGAPIITVQPAGQILSPGDLPSLGVTASGTGPLSYQWYRNGTAIGGAGAGTYAPPAFQAADDGTIYTVSVSDTFGNTTASTPATLSLLHDLTAWLTANPDVAAAIKWQFKSADPANYYLAPDDTSKIAWAAWSPGQKADLEQAYLDAAAWYSQGMPAVTMVPGGPGLTDQPVNLHPSVANDLSTTFEQVSPAYMWKLYTAHVAFSLLLETSRQVPWSVKDYPAPNLAWIFDSATMAWLTPPNTNVYWMGTYESAWVPSLRANNRPRTSFADPRWTFRWLREAGILGSTRLATIGGTLDWMRQNMTHFFGGDTFGNDAAVWQYRGWSPISAIVYGTTDLNNPGYGLRHWTAGCHGSTGFVHSALRVVNIPVQPVWVTGHELMYFMSEDLYMDHGDDPYNQVVKASGAPSLGLLIDSATWRQRFGSDETVNILDPNDPAKIWIGYAASQF